MRETLCVKRGFRDGETFGQTRPRAGHQKRKPVAGLSFPARRRVRHRFSLRLRAKNREGAAKRCMRAVPPADPAPVLQSRIGSGSAGRLFLFFEQKIEVERQRRGFIPAWGKHSVTPGEVSLSFILKTAVEAYRPFFSGGRGRPPSQKDRFYAGKAVAWDRQSPDWRGPIPHPKGEGAETVLNP